jgi:hypothetical protein
VRLLLACWEMSLATKDRLKSRLSDSPPQPGRAKCSGRQPYPELCSGPQYQDGLVALAMCVCSVRQPVFLLSSAEQFCLAGFLL